MQLWELAIALATGMIIQHAGVHNQPNPAAFHIGHGHHWSHCSARCCLNLSVRQQGKRNKVAKRAERAQLLVHDIAILQVAVLALLLVSEAHCTHLVIVHL